MTSRVSKKLFIFLHVLIVTAVACGLFLVLQPLISKQPFTWDESVYLTKARSWMELAPADQYSIYRPIGMAVVGWGLLQFSDSEAAIRTFGVVAGIATILAIYLLFWKVTNIWIAATTAIVIASSPLFLRETPQFYNDIPSSALLLGLLYVIYTHYESAGHTKSILFAPLFAALAFYLRYGVITTIALIALLSLVILVPSFRKKENVQYRNLQKNFLYSMLLFSPHFIYSYIRMGEPLGILSLGGNAAGRKYLGEGLLTYLEWLPHGIGGWVFGITAVIGILMTCLLIFFRKHLPKNYFNLFWIGTIGLTSFIVTGLLVHAESRYIFFPLILLVGTGISSLFYILEARSKMLARGTAAFLSAAALVLGVGYYHTTYTFFREREQNPATIAYIGALQAIERESTSNKGCAVWLALFRPTASWYSQCNILQVSDAATFLQDARTHGGKDLYSVVLTKIREPQLLPQQAEAYGITMEEIFRTNGTSRGDVIVYRIITKTSEDTRYNEYLPP